MCGPSRHAQQCKGSHSGSRGQSQTPDQPRAEFQGTEAARCSGHRGSLCSSMASPKRLQGLTAATITPMTPDGEINLSVIGQYVDYLVKEQGVKNVFVNGTTGEGLALSTQERKQLAEEWVTKGKNKLDHVIIHVGALNLPEAKEMAKHAAVIGASGIAAIAPFFFKPTNKDTLVAFLREIASEAPGIPFYYYHIPSLTGVKIRVEELLDGIKEQIPTFQGVKFSDTDLLDFAQCVKNNKEQFVLLYGVDEHLLSALAMGASGAVGSTYNYLGKKYNLMLEAFAKQDLVLAQQHQFCTGEFLSFVFKLGFGVAQTKAVMSFTSRIPMGPPRLPLLSASMDFIEKAKAKMDSLME
ncbi:N-acetylneuraminate lyase isoform X2 [Gopherus flavomarginatus]|uniref:N-acetylneuraminate lyase isoform X2 n=1 Tax=Gopherus flavomarginatus TaxID=286002 RepID=UPI0021CBDF41|nr:N-acetylneuraminate lyase isoform X2 [Gopherus flavomarginatus]